jgi:zinc transporter 1
MLWPSYLQPWQLTSQVYDAHIGHRHGARDAGKKGYDLGLLAVFIHILGDAANNIGVVIAGAVIWKADYAGRYYADPAVSMAIAVVILVTSIPLGALTAWYLLSTVYSRGAQ